MSCDFKKLPSACKAKNVIGDVRLFLDSFRGLSALVRLPAGQEVVWAETTAVRSRMRQRHLFRRLRASTRAAPEIKCAEEKRRTASAD